eukprot:577311_1
MAQKDNNNKPQNNVEFVLLAEFDIDKGSTVRHQYPRRCPISENILADLMLPEGAHLREQDWTYFFLRESEKQTTIKKNKRRETKIDKWEKNRRELISSIDTNTFSVQVLEFSESVSDWFIMHDVATCNFTYGGEWDVSMPEVSLCITEVDTPSNVICSVLVNVDLQWTVLSETELFCSFYPPHGNAMGVKFHGFAHLKVATDIVQQVTEPPARPPQPLAAKEAPAAAADEEEEECDMNLEEQIIVLNLVRTQKDKSVKRGAVVKAIAIATRLRILETFKPLLTLALDDYYRTESLDVLSSLYRTLNEVVFDADDAGDADNAMRQQMSNKELDTFSVSIRFHGVNMRLAVPRSIGIDEITGVSMRALFMTFRRNNGMSLLYNGVLTQRRIIFVGHNLASDLIANMVLSACLLVSPSVEGTLKRAYPYACLTAMQFLQVSGYIAGVTNPIFEQREEWFDILCNVATGDVRLSESYQAEVDADQIGYNKVVAIDKILMHEIRNGLQLKYGEKYIRGMFQDYTDHIVKIALDLEVFENDDIKKHDFDVNEWRIAEWEKTDSYLQTLQLMEVRNAKSPFKSKTREMNMMIRTIQIRPLEADKARTYLAKIDHWLDSAPKIHYFVTKLNPSLGHRVAQYMFHHDEFISGKALDIAIKLESYSHEEEQPYLEAAEKLIKSLNFFYIVAFERLKLERSAGLRKQKQLKRKLQSNDIHTGKIEYTNYQNVNAMIVKQGSADPQGLASVASAFVNNQ